MRRFVMVTVVLAAFALPVGTAAAKTSKADKQEARQECRAQRGHDKATREAFRAEWGNLGKCINATAKEAKAERKAAKRNASRDCRDERSADADAFKEKYGTNGNKSNAFGKCVSQTAKATREEQDEEDAEEAEEQTNAAHQCASERDADRQAFEETYGTNHNKKNAFGKCVSQKTHEDGEGTQDDG